MQLSSHFSLAEMTVTKTGLSNVPNQNEKFALTALCLAVLEPVRTHFAKPVTILSGFRSAAVNKKVGGASTSQHLYGEAADICIAGVENAEIWRFIVANLPFDQVIAEKLNAFDGAKGWIHVSYRKERLRHDAISFLGKGRGYVKGLQFVG